MKAWPYISAFLAGAAVVAIGIALYAIKQAKPLVNADNYIGTLEQAINKLKQKGEGNVQEYTYRFHQAGETCSETCESEKKERKPFLGIRLGKKKKNVEP